MKGATNPQSFDRIIREVFAPRIFTSSTTIAASGPSSANKEPSSTSDFSASSNWPTSWGRCMRAAQEEQPQPSFDPEAYEALLNERHAFFNGEKFFDNAILGTPQQCIDTIQTIQKELTHVHLVLKLSSTDHGHNRWMLSRFNAEIRPHI